MAESVNESKLEEGLDPILVEARRLLEEIRQARAQVAEQLAAAEVARGKADSEGLFAFNAKETCEKHATAIASLKGGVESDVASISTNKQKSDDFLAASSTAKAGIEADKQAISDLRKQVDQSALNISMAAESGAARLVDLEGSKTTAETLLKTTTAASGRAEQAASGTEQARTSADLASTRALENLRSTVESEKGAKTSAGSTETILLAAQQSKLSLDDVVKHLQDSDAITEGFKNALGEHLGTVDFLIKKYRGATSWRNQHGFIVFFQRSKGSLC